MADQLAVVTFTTPSTNTVNFSVTSPDITDTMHAAVVLFSAETTDDTTHAHAITGIAFAADDGVSTSEVDVGLAARSADALTSTQITRTVKYTGPTTDVLIGAPVDASTTAAFQIRTDFVSMAAGGITLDPVTVDSQTKAAAMLIAGVSRAFAGIAAATTVGSAEVVGGTGNEFEPDLVIFSGNDGTFSGGGTFSLSGANSLGFAVNDGSATQKGQILWWENAIDPSDANAIVASDNIPSVTSGLGAGGLQEATIAFTSTGFTATSNTGSPDFAYLAIKFANPDTRFGVFNFPVAASTGLQSFNCGFLPRAVLGMSQLVTTEDVEVDGLGGFGRSMFTADNARAYAASSQDGLTVAPGVPSVAKTRQGDHALLTLGNDATVVQQADFSAFTGSGFTLNFTTASAAGIFTCIAIGEDFPPVSLTDPVSISETLVAFLNATRSFTDQVEISESCASFTNNVAITEGPKGRFFSAGADRGTFLGGGAVAGIVQG